VIQDAQVSPMDSTLRPILDEFRRQLETIYDGRMVSLVLYGSQARGDAEPGSDIDVLVVLEGPVAPGREIERTTNIVADLALRFNEVISCVFMDEARFRLRNGPFLRNVRREGIFV
jgi:predicted nucleotidyltransferase